MAVADKPKTDFRSERMPSAEGQGRARRAWQAYSKAVERYATPIFGPLVEPVAEKLAGAAAVDLAGFWLVWHLEGGFEGLQRIGMSRASIYRRIALFRRIFNAHPDEYEFPGVTVDVAAYLASSATPIADRATHPRMKSQIQDK